MLVFSNTLAILTSYKTECRKKLIMFFRNIVYLCGILNISLKRTTEVYLRIIKFIGNIKFAFSP